MRGWRGTQSTGSDDHDLARGGPAAGPGKRTLTEGLAAAPGAPVQLRAAAGERRPAAPPSREIKERRSQTMTSGTGSWNNTFGWDSKMHVSVDGTRGVVTTTVRLHTTAPPATRAAWETSIEDRWSRHYDLLVNAGASDAQRYVIVVDVVWVDRARDAHYVVTPIDPASPPPGRTLGRGGTVSMTEWGTGTAEDVPHEFGHMLGNADEYNTVNGVAHGEPNRADGTVMNDPDHLPTAQHYDGIRRAACSVLGIGEALGSVAATAGPPVPLGEQRDPQPLEGEDGPIPLSPPGTAVA